MRRVTKVIIVKVFNVTPDRYQNLDNLINYNKDKQDYILARLYLLRNFIKDGNKSKALDCIDNIIKDLTT